MRKKDMKRHVFVMLAAASLVCDACGNNTTDGTENNTTGDNTTSTAPTVFGSVEADDQLPSPANEIVVREVFSAGLGFIVIHEDDGFGAPGPILGFAPVTGGTSSDVTVTLDRDSVDGEKLHAMLYDDRGVEGAREFPGADGPAPDDEGEVVAPMVTTIE